MHYLTPGRERAYCLYMRNAAPTTPMTFGELNLRFDARTRTYHYVKGTK